MSAEPNKESPPESIDILECQAQGNYEVVEVFRDFLHKERQLAPNRENRPEYLAWRDQFGVIAQAGDAINIAVADEEFSSPQSFIHIAYVANEPAAFDIVSLDEKKQNKSSYLVVGVQYQRKGIGKRLLASRHEKLRSLGIYEYSLLDASEEFLQLLQKENVSYSRNKNNGEIEIKLEA